MYSRTYNKLDIQINYYSDFDLEDTIKASFKKLQNVQNIYSSNQYYPL